VTRVLAARIAELLGFHAIGMLLPILGRRVVPVFAIVALQRNDFSHQVSSKLLNNLRALRPPRRAQDKPAIQRFL
jgi:hypothetical protein